MVYTHIDPCLDQNLPLDAAIQSFLLTRSIQLLNTIAAIPAQVPSPDQPPQNRFDRRPIVVSPDGTVGFPQYPTREDLFQAVQLGIWKPLMSLVVDPIQKLNQLESKIADIATFPRPIFEYKFGKVAFMETFLYLAENITYGLLAPSDPLSQSFTTIRQQSPFFLFLSYLLYLPDPREDNLLQSFLHKGDKMNFPRYLKLCVINHDPNSRIDVFSTISSSLKSPTSFRDFQSDAEVMKQRSFWLQVMSDGTLLNERYQDPDRSIEDALSLLQNELVEISTTLVNDHSEMAPIDTAILKWQQSEVDQCQLEWLQLAPAPDYPTSTWSQITDLIPAVADYSCEYQKYQFKVAKGGILPPRPEQPQFSIIDKPIATNFPRWCGDIFSLFDLTVAPYDEQSFDLFACQLHYIDLYFLTMHPSFLGISPTRLIEIFDLFAVAEILALDFYGKDNNPVSIAISNLVYSFPSAPLNSSTMDDTPPTTFNPLTKNTLPGCNASKYVALINRYHVWTALSTDYKPNCNINQYSFSAEIFAPLKKFGGQTLNGGGYNSDPILFDFFKSTKMLQVNNPQLNYLWSSLPYCQTVLTSFLAAFEWTKEGNVGLYKQYLKMMIDNAWDAMAQRTAKNSAETDTPRATNLAIPLIDNIDETNYYCPTTTVTPLQSPTPIVPNPVEACNTSAATQPGNPFGAQLFNLGSFGGRRPARNSREWPLIPSDPQEPIFDSFYHMLCEMGRNCDSDHKQFCEAVHLWVSMAVYFLWFDDLFPTHNDQQSTDSAQQSGQNGLLLHKLIMVLQYYGFFQLDSIFFSLLSVNEHRDITSSSKLIRAYWLAYLYLIKYGLDGATARDGDEDAFKQHLQNSFLVKSLPHLQRFNGLLFNAPGQFQLISPPQRVQGGSANQAPGALADLVASGRNFSVRNESYVLNPGDPEALNRMGSMQANKVQHITVEQFWEDANHIFKVVFSSTPTPTVTQSFDPLQFSALYRKIIAHSFQPTIVNLALPQPASMTDCDTTPQHQINLAYFLKLLIPPNTNATMYTLPWWDDILSFLMELSVLPLAVVQFQ